MLGVLICRYSSTADSSGSADLTGDAEYILGLHIGHLLRAARISNPAKLGAQVVTWTGSRTSNSIEDISVPLFQGDVSKQRWLSAFDSL